MADTHTTAPLPLAAKVLKKILRKIYMRRTLILLAHDLADGHRTIKASSRMDARRFAATDFPACEPHFSHEVEALRDFLAHGYPGFCGFSRNNGEMGAMVWYADTTFTDRFYGCTVDLAEGEVFQMAGEVAEPYRNSPITANLMFMGWDYWIAQGKQRVLTLIQDDNAPSMKFAMSGGFRESGIAYVIHRILGMRVYRKVHYSGERFSHHKKQNRHT
ncbi:Hypothetical protein HDN1F_25190 [gamma proteobacterium HdN1]|nr:Hypothetical protein HDN1F_25190 [gamma proteobacterium HdN1]